MKSNKLTRHFLKYDRPTLNKKQKIEKETNNLNLTERILNKKFKKERNKYYLKLFNFFY